MSGGFNNPIIGDGGGLVYPSIHSPNFAHLAAGWSINKDGSAEFNSLTLRGTFFGTSYIINSAGAFFYGGVPAAGNLIASIASASGTDSFGNSYTGPGFTTYDAVNNDLINIGGSNIEWVGTSFSAPTITALPSSAGADLALFSGTATNVALQAVMALQDSVKSGTGTPRVLITGTALLVGNGPAATTDLAEIQGIIAFSGSNTSPSAPSPPQALANGVASQLSDTTRDYMLYLVPSGAGNLTIQIGSTSAVGRSILPATAAVAGALYNVRIPAGWFVKWTGTGTVALASQTVVGC